MSHIAIEADAGFGASALERSKVIKRFRPTVAPDDPAVVGAIEENLPG